MVAFSLLVLDPHQTLLLMPFNLPDLQAVVAAAQAAIAAAGEVQGLSTSGTAIPDAAGSPGQAGLSPVPPAATTSPVVTVKDVVSQMSDATCRKLTQDEIDECFFAL